MLTLKNTGKGPRMVLLTSGKYEIFKPGEQKSLDGAKVRGIPADMVEVEVEAQGAGDVPEQPAGLAQKLVEKQFRQLDHDGDGEPGGSLPHDPPALSEMTRAELEAQAAAEGIDIGKIPGSGRNGAVVMSDIRNAIEVKRAAGAA